MKTSVLAITLLAGFAAADICAPCTQLRTAAMTCRSSITSIPTSLDQAKIAALQLTTCVCTKETVGLIEQCKACPAPSDMTKATALAEVLKGVSVLCAKVTGIAPGGDASGGAAAGGAPEGAPPAGGAVGGAAPGGEMPPGGMSPGAGGMPAGGAAIPPGMIPAPTAAPSVSRSVAGSAPTASSSTATGSSTSSSEPATSAASSAASPSSSEAKKSAASTVRSSSILFAMAATFVGFLATL